MSISNIEITKDKIIVKINQQTENTFRAYIVEKDKVDNVLIKVPCPIGFNDTLKISNIGKKTRLNIDTLGNFGVTEVELEDRVLIIRITQFN